jgi:hypothetical protein
MSKYKEDIQIKYQPLTCDDDVDFSSKEIISANKALAVNKLPALYYLLTEGQKQELCEGFPKKVQEAFNREFSYEIALQIFAGLYKHLPLQLIQDLLFTISDKPAATSSFVKIFKTKNSDSNTERRLSPLIIPEVSPACSEKTSPMETPSPPTAQTFDAESLNTKQRSQSWVTRVTPLHNESSISGEQQQISSSKNFIQERLVSKQSPNGLKLYYQQRNQELTARSSQANSHSR